jgi:HK97 family phage prohead protease
MGKEYLDVKFEIKSIEEDGTIKGLGSVFDDNPDEYGDIVVKGAFKKSIRKGGRNGTGFPMLWQHNSDEPIGKWVSLKETNEGLELIGKITRGVQKAEEAYLLMKDEVVQALSIGYDTRNGAVEFDHEKGIRYLKEVNLWEISAVTFPAKTTAVVTDVKNIKNAKNERELERALRDAGLSINCAKVVVSKAKHALKRDQSQNEILKELRKWSTEIKIKNYLNTDI